MVYDDDYRYYYDDYERKRDDEELLAELYDEACIGLARHVPYSKVVKIKDYKDEHGRHYLLFHFIDGSVAAVGYEINRFGDYDEITEEIGVCEGDEENSLAAKFSDILLRAITGLGYKVRMDPDEFIYYYKKYSEQKV